MNTYRILYLVFVSFFTIIFFTETVAGQTYHVDSEASDLKVAGTSNVHDWEITGKGLDGSITVQMEGGQIVEVNKLNFTVVSESLKSGKGGMDKNTYKALKTKDHRNITYQLTKVNNLDCTSTTACKINTSGVLTITGIKQQVNIIFDAKVAGNKITLTGTNKIKMTDYNVEPPTAMFGTITTGNEVTVKFRTVFQQ